MRASPFAQPARLIRIVAGVVMDGAGQTLLVRKRGTQAFMQPGGKRDEGEPDIAALKREIAEELGCELEPASCRLLDQFTAPAANEPGWAVEAEIFAVTLAGEVRPSAEMVEAVWIDPDVEPSIQIAPLTRRHALPATRLLKLQKVGP